MKNSIDYILRSDLSFCSPEMEVIFIEIKESSMKSKIIGCVYLKLQSCLDILDREKKEVFMLGDYNINLLNHYSHNETNEFLETMFANNLYPLISKPTRITARSCTNTFYENVESGLLYTDLLYNFPVYIA